MSREGTRKRSDAKVMGREVCGICKTGNEVKEGTKKGRVKGRGGDGKGMGVCRISKEGHGMA